VTKPRAVRSVAALAVLAMVLVACGGGGSSTPAGTQSAGGVTKGGTYRTAIEDFGYTDAFDPTGEYLGTAWGLFSDMLVRTLVTYKHIADVPGDEIVPDIAEKWETSSDGLTWTFHLKQGVMFGPPVSRAVTSKDIAYAFQRINTTSLTAQYGNYYDGVIEGMDGQSKSEEDPISGIETPDDQTIIFHLTKPTGDFLYRVAMPATGPVPPEVGKCFTKAGDYGRFVISSGPYMMKGEDALDTSSCATLKKNPISGFDPDKFQVFVRNPNYDASTDSPEVRENNIDGVVITINTNTDDIFNKIQSGDLDGSWASTPPKALLAQYLQTNPELKDNLKINSADRTWYITMNMLVPPFDDINVRKAVNFVIDKDAIQKAWGGEAHGQIATAIEPPTVLPEEESYNPYPSPNNAGDLSAAEAAMKQSKYDSNGDGKCDGDVCNNLLMISRNYSPWTDMDPIIVDDLAKIGIHVKLRELDSSTAYTTIQTADKLIPIAANAGWGKDYADPFGFDFFPFNSAGIACNGQINYAEMGMSESQAKACGSDVLAAWNAATDNGKNPLPSVDQKMDECYSATGDARTQCWLDLDKYVMEDAVPWVPYLWATVFTAIADSVTKYEYDEFAGAISFCHIAVNNGLDPNDVPVG
jgi:peptide/nickel transport system substrate-binding protein